MAISAESFIYDGIPCEQFGLRIYEIDGEASSAGVIDDGAEVISDEIIRRARPIHYGLSYGKPLSFNLVFGAPGYLDRYDIQAISKWLLGRQTFAPLIFCRDDWGQLRYNAIITQLEEIQINGFTIAFNASVVCDSPYAYLPAREIIWTLNGTSGDFSFNNKSNIRGYYAPVITVQFASNSDFVINNTTTNEKFSLEFGDTNISGVTVNIDSENQILTASNAATPINLYKYMKLDGEEHFVFPKFINGNNDITITAHQNCVVKITPLFPINVGF